MDNIRGNTIDSGLTVRHKDLKITTRTPEPKKDEPAKPLDTIALTQAIAGLGQNLEVGEKVTLKAGKEIVAEVTKEGKSNWDRFADGAIRFGKASVMEIQEAIETDPAFAFREGVETVKDTLTQAAPETVRELAIKGLYPGVRAGVFALDIYKAYKTLKDPNAGLAQKIIDVGHCITDFGGLVAAAAPLIGLAIPGANVLAAVAYTADIISFAFHGLGYFGKKVRRWREKKEAKEKEQNKPEAPKPEDAGQKPPVQDVKKSKESGKGKKK